MGGFGWHNPWPLEFGGGETVVERIYYALRSAAGQGGSAENDDYTIDGLWRQVRARAIASAATTMERAALQVLPDHATDLLPYYEQLLLLTPDPSQSEQARRDAAAQLYALQIASDLPSITRALQQIDPRFSIVVPRPEASCTTINGRAFEDYAATLPFEGGRKSTAFPNYSSNFETYVLLDLGGGVVPAPIERAAMTTARRLLQDVLPGHNTLHVVTHRGFTLDRDRLDLTSFGG